MPGGQQRPAGKETEVTAELDNRGLVQLQQQVMQQQDRELEQMEKTIISTKVRLDGAACSTATGHWTCAGISSNLQDGLL